MDPENQRIDINLADEETLTELQGVGARLAKRIIAARPFSDVDDLARVRGISEEDVNRLRGVVVVMEAEGAEVADEIEVAEETDEVEVAEGAEETEGVEEGERVAVVAADLVEDAAEVEAEGVDEAVAEVEDVEEIEEITEPVTAGDEEETLAEALDPEPAVPAVQADYMTRGGACSLIFIGAFITLIVAVAVTLGILSGINQGRLDYASPADISALQSHTEALTLQSQTLAQDIDGLRTRMDNLESLSSQVSAIETELNAMRAEISDLQAQITQNQADYDDLVSQLETLNADIELLYDQGERSESFLEGLRSLMENLFPPEIEETP